MHYDTGSESEEEPDIKDETKVVVKPDENIVQVEEVEAPETSSAEGELLSLFFLGTSGVYSQTPR